ncbi:MAG: tyrosine-type recombinase/integrase [Actinomycetaceae bacterium]|nr:tyrosine-type recombinase/integrase [Actinomycetaceae bacterium]MDY5273004.1 tyrosine-type recombinase/integrase [Arcanobacterium sp.]
MPPRPRPVSDIAYYGAKRDADAGELLMLRFAAEAGLRRGEVAQIHESDFIRDLLGFSLLVHGKGGKERHVPLEDSLAREALRTIREQGGGYLFPGNDNGHLSARWIGKRISRLLPDGVTMHALRHRFATKIYSGSHDILATQQLLGHASPATTQLYVGVDAARLRDVARAAA